MSTGQLTASVWEMKYGQELVSTNRPDTFAQTKPHTTTILLAISRRTIQFPWPAFSRGKCWISRYSATQGNVPHLARNVRRDRLSMSASAI
jgi:hypothetical protein